MACAAPPTATPARWRPKLDARSCSVSSPPLNVGRAGRAADQDEQRKNRPLTMPVLAIGGERSFGENVGNAVRAVAPEVQSVVITDTGHFLAEESPDELLTALTPFLTPYRDASATAPAAAASSH
jgi:pimeloyl-ACP methyl ester carboxylesterase